MPCWYLFRIRCVFEYFGSPKVDHFDKLFAFVGVYKNWKALWVFDERNKNGSFWQVECIWSNRKWRKRSDSFWAKFFIELLLIYFIFLESVGSPDKYDVTELRNNNIGYCGYTTKSRWRSIYSCIRQHPRSLIRCAQSPDSFQSTSCLYFCSALSSFAFFSSILIKNSYTFSFFSCCIIKISSLFLSTTIINNSLCKWISGGIFFYFFIYLHCERHGREKDDSVEDMISQKYVYCQLH